ncbi:Esterase/lipase [Tranquillimonas rosea]|uniref:Esterase/lipase n=1 Tax=Tranquillimonas rosea TaxID=641238 RepID=A0A1H9WDT5_9RHOB|nr:alpha/beta fold hydrolase [Tranquillimonas rosea]SES31623.1 Esterase/lipase [Tranquillimonas rosea]
MRLIRAVIRWAIRLFVLAVIALVALWIFAPREEVALTVDFDPAQIGDDIDAYLEEREAQYDDLVDGVRKRVEWEDDEGERTDWAVVYVHGFSASSEEIRPVPEDVADALEANIYYTRLAGHGRDGDAMAEPDAGDWMNDYAEAMAIGRRIGERVLVISTSTGGTIAAAAATDRAMMEDVAGLVFLSPNFRLKSRAARLLTVPGAEYLLPVFAGRVRGFTPQNDAHADYWTERYPSEALFPMAHLVDEVKGMNFGTVETPALFMFSDADQVVDHRATRDVASEWGGPAILAPQQVPEGNDPMNHVIAGDILSPDMTPIVLEQIVGWARNL